MPLPTVRWRYTKKDFETDQDVRWCPGCGDYAILSAVQRCFPELGIPREKFVVVSGIGCSSRFPYYMNTYGFHTIHGRAPAIATGIKLAQPELSVWVATGDGDALSIGGNHMIHMLRRNVDIKILLFNNRIYGLTKGQLLADLGASARRRSRRPYGSVDRPFNPLALALGAEATFVARSVDVFQPHLKAVLQQAAAPPRHGVRRDPTRTATSSTTAPGTASPTRQLREDNTLVLEHGRAARLRQERRTRGSGCERPRARGGDARRRRQRGGPRRCTTSTIRSPAYAFLLSRMDATPGFPTPIGVLRVGGAPATSRRSASRCGGHREEGQGRPREAAALGRHLGGAAVVSS